MTISPAAAWLRRLSKAAAESSSAAAPPISHGDGGGQFFARAIDSNRAIGVPLHKLIQDALVTPGGDARAPLRLGQLGGHPAGRAGGAQHEHRFPGGQGPSQLIVLQAAMPG